MRNKLNITEISINYKNKVKTSERIKIEMAEDAEKLFRAIWSDRMDYIEEMYLLLINRANRVLGYTKISQGGTAGTVVDIKVIFQSALRANAQSIIIAHNHPSQQLSPSEADKRLTKKIFEAGKLLEIELLDHLIITSDGCFSFAKERLL